jgi:hypothetical protein
LAPKQTFLFPHILISGIITIKPLASGKFMIFELLEKFYDVLGVSNKYALMWGDKLYIASRNKYRDEWEKRNSLFEKREDWNWSKWQNAVVPESYWDLGLYKFILFNVSNYFCVNIKKLRPNDSFTKELLFPGEKFHWRMASELFDEIELSLDACMKTEDYRDVYAPHELYDGTISEFLQFFQKLWNQYPHTDTPPWESKKWNGKWLKYTKGFFEANSS